MRMCSSHLVSTSTLGTAQSVSRGAGQRMLSSGKMIVFFIIIKCLEIVRAERELMVISVATDKTDGYKRFERSCQIYGLPLRTLGMGQVWQGGDMNYPGGGWKVNLLKEEMEKIKSILKILSYQR